MGNEANQSALEALRQRSTEKSLAQNAPERALSEEGLAQKQRDLGDLLKKLKSSRRKSWR